MTFWVKLYSIQRGPRVSCRVWNRVWRIGPGVWGKGAEGLWIFPGPGLPFGNVGAMQLKIPSSLCWNFYFCVFRCMAYTFPMYPRVTGRQIPITPNQHFRIWYIFKLAPWLGQHTTFFHLWISLIISHICVVNTVLPLWLDFLTFSPPKHIINTKKRFNEFNVLYILILT